MRLILASTSPRRRELLSLLGVPFDTADPNIPESVIPGISCADQALRLAVEKARVCAERYPDAVVLGSDTLIELDGALIGKPVDREDAVSILRRLRGRLHLIHTAIAAARGSADAATAVETV
ncbi:MAG TPA: Maf family protein, partial [Nitrospirales bacterium]|nr:Maf family protein [Nitrospirales bacterium]